MTYIYHILTWSNDNSIFLWPKTIEIRYSFTLFLSLLSSLLMFIFFMTNSYYKHLYSTQAFNDMKPHKFMCIASNDIDSWRTICIRYNDISSWRTICIRYKYTIVLVPEELIIYLRVESILQASLKEKLLEYKYESYCIEFFFLSNQKLVSQWE